MPPPAGVILSPHRGALRGSPPPPPSPRSTTHPGTTTSVGASRSWRVRARGRSAGSRPAWAACAARRPTSRGRRACRGGGRGPPGPTRLSPRPGGTPRRAPTPCSTGTGAGRRAPRGTPGTAPTARTRLCTTHQQAATRPARGTTPTSARTRWRRRGPTGGRRRSTAGWAPLPTASSSRMRWRARASWPARASLLGRRSSWCWRWSPTSATRSTCGGRRTAPRRRPTSPGRR
mmetsp:Transcript_33761/g.86500  ORF Transcript_33761/g.86500 Transcript_33761/m.86500 type:complete len:232 (+) Transcript_33761:801-1496(+)